MQQENINKKAQKKFEDFLEHRKNMPDSDKKLALGAVIEQIGAINVDKAFEKVNLQICRSGKKVRLRPYLTRIAAVLTLPLLAFTIWSLFIQEKATPKYTELTWQELSSPAGMRSQITLPDGTQMWINAQSKVRYSMPFVRERRSIELSGEAFLKVTPDPKSPFVVKSGNTAVEVLGTQFNIKAYDDENNIEIALKEGKVKFDAKHSSRQKSIGLKPGDHMVFDKKTGQVKLKNTDINKYIAWHDNVLILDETPMEEVAVLLQRWYGVKVVIRDNELKKYKFTTTFENESLFRVLELLELSSPDIKIKYKPGKINSKTGKTDKSTVLINLNNKCL